MLARFWRKEKRESDPKPEIIRLPTPELIGEKTVEEALAERRSVREYADQPLTLAEVSQLLWAAQGITESRMGLRTAPSAGALYPLELYVVKNDGVWHYLPHKHSIELIIENDLRSELSNAALGQSPIKQAPVDIVITGIYKRVTSKYGNRGIRYTHIEAGHAAQNLLLEATALGLVSVPIGAFYDESVKTLLKLKDGETPLYIIPVGYKK